MKVELIDLVERFKDEKKELKKCFIETISKGHLILTSEVKNFEDQICKYTGVKYCLGLNSGTDALMMALWCLKIGRGDEVITTCKSFVATIASIVHVGAKPILVDVNDDLNIDVEEIEKKITKKTRAIMPVHWTGRICNMDKIKEIAKKYNLEIIEDAAQAMGSYYKNKHAGNFSKIACFSAHPLKNLNALGDAGYIITNKKELYDKILLFRNHGLRSRDNVEIFGVNSRLDSLNASVLSMRLGKLNKIIERRRKNIELYRKCLSDVPEINLPKDKSYEYSSYVMFISRCKNRDNLQKYLNSKNIQSLIYYGTPLHLQKASKILGYKKGDFPIAEKVCKEVLALPHHQYLSDQQIIYVCENIKKFYKLQK